MSSQMLYAHRKYREEKEKKRQELQKSREMKNCTFRPHLNKKKNNVVASSGGFMARLAKSNEAKAARLKRLQEEKERRIQNQLGGKKQIKKKNVDFDRLYRSGSVQDRLERAKKIKEEEYAKHTFRPQISGARKTKPIRGGSNIHERLHQAAAR